MANFELPGGRTMKICRKCYIASYLAERVHAMRLKIRSVQAARLPACLSVILGVAALGMSIPASTAPDARQSTLFVNNCAQCHTRQETGAPFIGVAEDWRDAIARGEDAMLVNVVEGIRGMPPLGYCSACSEEDFRVLIRMMAGIPDTKGEQQ